MKHQGDVEAIAIVGVGAVLPGSPDVPTLWKNLQEGRSSIVETPQDRWDSAKYFDPDPKAVDKSYSNIGGWVLESPWDPMAWRLPIPPKVTDKMDRTQKWGIAAAREALFDFGYPERTLDRERTAIIIGNAMGGDNHYYTSLRVFAPEYLAGLKDSAAFQALSEHDRASIADALIDGIRGRVPDITEDTMPGELSNIIAGRIAAVFDLHGPNFVADAACASAMAAMSASVEGLLEHHYDAVITGGVDANMSPSTFVKFSKIGALSATGSRPYDVGANGFVMGEGAAMFLMKRLEDAERDGDRIYAVVRGLGGASDGKGKGITAPNPIGQRLAVKRAWSIAEERPDLDTLIEGHGTSTRVGDVVEVQSLAEALADFDLPTGSIPIGSIKSNIGHLKGAAGAAGMLKATLSLHHKMLPPSINHEVPNPNIDFEHIPFFVNTELRPWEKRTASGIRRVGVSAFGFGGTNFHAVLEEHEPGRLTRPRRATVSVEAPMAPKSPLRGLALLGGADVGEIRQKIASTLAQAESGQIPPRQPPARTDLDAPIRLGVDFEGADELKERLRLADKAIATNNPMAFLPLRARGVHLGRGPKPPIAFLYTGQGSQYVNMLRSLRETEPVVAETIAEADRVMTPILGRSLSSYLFVDPNDEAAMDQANRELRQTAITQPAVLTVDAAMTRLMAAYGITPDMVMGHSLGEYGALVAAGGISFAHALEAVAARGKEMTNVSMTDNGKMAAVMGPIEQIEQVLEEVDGYVVLANLNSRKQAVIGGTSPAVEAAVARFEDLGMRAQFIPVSHAFHTSIVASASGPLESVLRRLDLRSVEIPLVGNVDGEFYPTGPDVSEQMVALLGRQVASPVQFVKGLEKLYEAGARVFVEVGPKKALHGFAEEVLGAHEDVLALFTNHPKLTDEAAFNQALTGLYARGAGCSRDEERPAARPAAESSTSARRSRPRRAREETAMTQAPGNGPKAPSAPGNGNGHGPANGGRPASSFGQVRPAAATPAAGPMGEVGALFAHFMEQAFQVMGSGGAGVDSSPVVVSGASVGLPGEGRVFRDDNVARLLRGDQYIESIPHRIRNSMVERHITRVVKSADGSGSFETIGSAAEGIKLAGQPGDIRLVEDFGFPEDRAATLDSTTELAIGAAIEALKDAGIPLVMHYKTTTRGTFLPERWMLPESMQEDTGVIFGSAFPGNDNFAQEAEKYRVFKELEAREQELVGFRERWGSVLDARAMNELDRRIDDLRAEIEANPYVLDRKFIFRILAMGHSQLAEFIGARGPNTQVNAACASGTQGIGLAEDWIRTGRCRRVIVVSSDNVTSEALLPWIGAGFVATGAAATDERVEDAALPFDRRRHGLLLGMGASAVVVERADAVAERGLRPITEVLGTRYVNSAFHGTRLDPDHITAQVEALVADAERRFGVSRSDIARQLVFISHETYTPARGGSAQTEVKAIRTVFGDHADEVVVANTKGMTGHAMGTGIEDVLGIKALETGEVPPVPNFREVDPELGQLNLSKGGSYPVEYALRLGAGFGSQLALSLMRRSPGPRPSSRRLGYAHRIDDEGRWRQWLDQVSGHGGAQLEVVHRTLRVIDQGPTDAMVMGAVALTQGSRAGALPAGVPAAAVLDVPASSTTIEARSGRGGAVPPPASSPSIAPPPVAPAPTTDPVVEKIMALVAEQTGYPSDMLDPELDLEADLGIDTVKQAEMFTAVREAFDIERDPNLQLREFNTLHKVVGFVRDRRPDLALKAPAPAAPAAPGAPAQDPVLDQILALVAEQTGYPSDMLDPELDLEADLGIDTVKQAEMFAAVREAFDIERDPNLQLRAFNTLDKVAGFVRDRRPDLAVKAPAPAPAAPATPAAPARDPVLDQILALVAEQTGYPSDMLDPELDLEADLGIDTVKQAEMFAAVREAFDIERDPNLQLRAFNTLDKVAGFVRDRRPDLAQPIAPAAPASAPAGGAPQGGDGVLDRIMAIVAEQTGYPPDMLDPELDLEADLGIDTVKQAEMFAAVREAFGIERDPNLQLREFNTLDKVVGFVNDRRPAAPEPVGSSGPTAAAAPDDPILAKVLEIVAEQTGYPADMLDPDLDLEADLGIDTVKQAEMFAAVRESFAIERDPNLQLRDFNTMRLVVGFVVERRPDLTSAEAQGAPSAPSSAAPAAESAHPHALEGSLEAAAALPRRVPTPVLLPRIDVTKPTGVVLDAGTHVAVMPDYGGVADALIDALGALEVKVSRLEPEPSDEAIEALRSEGVDGVFWLPALDDEGDFLALELDAYEAANRRRVKHLHRTMQALYDSIATGGKFLVGGTRLGGRLGAGPEGATAPLGGAVSGFVKTFARERPEALSKVVDFALDASSSEVASALLEEAIRDPGPVEVGRLGRSRFTLGLEEISADNGEPGLELGASSVFVVTGAAGSITSAISADLVQMAPGATFYFLDLSPEPDPQDPDLVAYGEDLEGLKRTIAARLAEAGEKPTPVKVSRVLAGLERKTAALQAIEAVQAAGGEAIYHAVDLRDVGAVRAITADITAKHGRIDVLLHAGGLEISRLLPDKTRDEFELVFDVKARGWYAALAGCGEALPRATVVFSSIAGRFGNGGQADYAAANDLLAKTSAALRGRGVRALVMDWTAWGGIGMATRGSIPKMMEAAGIDMLPPDAGIAFIRRELTAGSRADEVVVALALGLLTEPRDKTGGVDLDAIASAGPMSRTPKGFFADEGWRVDSTLDPQRELFLDHHRIDGTPVLPGVMGMEAFAEAAMVGAAATVEGDWRVVELQDVAFAAPFKLYRDEPRQISVRAKLTPDGDDGLLCACELVGRRRPAGLDREVETVHFTGRVRLASTPREEARAPTSTDGPEVSSEDIYRVYFHGPAYQVLDSVARSENDAVGRIRDDLPPNHDPESGATVLAPRLVEACFQTEGVRSIGRTGALALPAAVGRLEWWGAPEAGPLYAVVSPADATGASEARVVDAEGRVVLRLAGYHTIEAPGTLPEEPVASFRAVFGSDGVD